MTHEPECAIAQGVVDVDPFSPCPTCNLIRIGYKRGREDAAQAVMRLIINNPTGSAGLSDAIAAARGGEQQ